MKAPGHGWPLRAKLATVVVVLSIVPVSAVAFWNIREARRQIFDDEAALLAASADHLADELDRFNDGYRRAVSRLANIPEIVERLSAPSPPASDDALIARLVVHVNDDPAVRGVGLLDRTGHVIAATEAPLIGRDRSFRRYVTDALKGVPVISDPYLAEDGDATIAFVAPVRGPDRSVIGLAVFWLHAEGLWAVARQANSSAGSGSYAVLLDKDGVRIGHTERSDLVFRPAGPLPPEAMARLLGERRFLGHTRELLGDVRPSPIQFERARTAVLDQTLFRGLSPATGKMTWGVGRRMASTQWTIFYLVPEATLEAPIANLTAEWIFLAGGVGLVALFGGVLLAGTILRPIQRLAAATAALASGDLTSRVNPPAGDDELGRLGRAFDVMAETLESQTQALRRSRDDLEERVRQRTADLSEREQSLATTLDSIGDAVIVTDPEGMVVRLNPTAQALTGWPSAEALGRPLAEVFRIVDEEHRRPVESPVVRALRERRVVGLANHTILLARGGTECPIADSAALISEPDGTVRGVVLVFRDQTAEREATLAIALSEEKYRDLYESSPDMYLTVALPAEVIVDCNGTLCNALGYRKAELVGRSALTLYPPDFAADADRERASFRKSGEFVDVERRLLKRDGSEMEVSMNLLGLRNADGRMIGARAVWRDIGKRKQAERDQRFLLELGETLEGSTDVPTVIRALATRLAQTLAATRCVLGEIDGANDRVTLHRAFGSDGGIKILPLSQFSQATMHEASGGATVVVNDTATDPRTASIYHETYRPLALTGFISVPIMSEGRWAANLIVASDRARVWEEREVSLVKLAAERVWLRIEHLRVLADLRRRAVADAVERTEARYQTVLDGITDYAILMLDPEGTIATWSSGAQRLKGYKASEIIGQHFSIFYPEAQRQAQHPEAILAQARTTGRCEEEGYRVRADGSYFWANVVITAIRGPDGNLEGFAKVTRDITERRRKDDELKQSLKEREVLLQEVHHRVKNNLQVISSLINMQGRQLPHGTARDALDECQTRVSAIALIHEKLYQSKDYSRVRFADYVRSLSANVLHATGISPQNVTLTLAIDDVPMGVDRAIPCGLVVNELITNALKHGLRNEGGSIRVELRDLGASVSLTVSDDGVGLPPGFDIATSKSMGLQLVSTLAEQLEANLVVTSERGASFQLTFARSD